MVSTVQSALAIWTELGRSAGTFRYNCVRAGQLNEEGRVDAAINVFRVALGVGGAFLNRLAEVSLRAPEWTPVCEALNEGTTRMCVDIEDSLAVRSHPPAEWRSIVKPADAYDVVVASDRAALEAARDLYRALGGGVYQIRPVQEFFHLITAEVVNASTRPVRSSVN